MRERTLVTRLKQNSALIRPYWFVAMALTATVAMPVHAETPTVEELLKRLEERDVVIEDLMRRVDELEHRNASPAVRSPSAVNGHAKGAVPVAVRPIPKPSTPAAPKLTAQAEPQGPTAPTDQAPAASERESSDRPQSQPAPGQFTIDEQAAERALERTLVATGALLVPFGQAEVQPTFNYTRQEQDVPAQVQVGTSVSFPTEKVKRNELTGTLDLRGGLPWDSQLEFSFPYNYAQQQNILQLGSSERQTKDRSGSALGELSVGLAKTVVRESGWRPDLIARVTYGSNLGQKRSNGVPLNGGINEVIGEIDLLKRQDPLAFVASGFYNKTFQDNGFKPGDEFGATLGAFLAASPETSLRFQLQQTFVDDLKLKHRVINDSNQVQSLMIIGASSVLGRGVLLDVSGGIGLTSDAPDYFVQVALPIRFDLPLPTSTSR
jgi:hypothetical protein